MPVAGKTRHYDEDWPLELLLLAARICMRNVSWKNSVLRWRIPRNRMMYCLDLKRELDAGRHRLAPFYTFWVTEPKRRKIQALLFRDRVVQVAMLVNGLYEEITSDNIADNLACQTGKGTSKALERMKEFLQWHFSQHGLAGYVFSFDFHDFFGSLVHDAIKAWLWPRITREAYRREVFMTIDAYGEKGLGLGSPLSQLIAVSCVSEIDHMIKEKHGVACYLRYSDDGRTIVATKEKIKAIVDDMLPVMRKFGISFNPKSCIHPVRQGVYFLKWRFTLTDTGEVVMTKKKSKVNRFIRHMRKMKREGVSQEDLLTSFRSWESHMRLGNSEAIINKVRKILNV